MRTYFQVEQFSNYLKSTVKIKCVWGKNFFFEGIISSCMKSVLQFYYTTSFTLTILKKWVYLWASIEFYKCLQLPAFCASIKTCSSCENFTGLHHDISNTPAKWNYLRSSAVSSCNKEEEIPPYTPGKKKQPHISGCNDNEKNSVVWGLLCSIFRVRSQIKH